MKLSMKILKLKCALSLVLMFTLNARAADPESQVDSAGFSLEETRQFAAMGDNVSSVKMSLAQVPDEFECPLFSNSPYKDILTAIDGLQTAINVFPKCENDKTNDLLSTSSAELRQKIIDAQAQQEKGETRQLSVSAEGILSAATKIQDLIGKAASKKDCYKTEDSKNVIFAINDTFQSIAPLALDFAAKNATLAPVLAEYLPVVAGAKALSTGLSVLESALRYVPTLDMSNPENRLAVIKNTCSFMKLYNKIEYLTLDRASRLKKINQDFDEKIKASQRLKRSMMVALTSEKSLGSMVLASTPEDTQILLIKDRAERYQTVLGQATDELAASGKNADIAVCSVVKTVIAMHTSKDILSDLVNLANLLKKEDQVDLKFKEMKLEQYEAEMAKAATLKDTSVCSDLGQQWIQAQKEALTDLKTLLTGYDATTATKTEESVAKVKMNREDKRAADLQANKEKLNIFTDLSVFEPGELDKRMRGMPKYLFNGTDGNWYQKLKKNGPVMDLLHDNEMSFRNALARFKSQANYLLGYEYKQITREMLNVKPASLGTADPVLERYQKEGADFNHVTQKYAPADSYEHRQLCDKSKLAIKAYVEATDQLVSSEYLCKMIDPVLKEPEVASTLRAYCQNSKTFWGQNALAGYKEVARPLFVKNGPKHQIEMIMKRLDDLDCD